MSAVVGALAACTVVAVVVVLAVTVLARRRMGRSVRLPGAAAATSDRAELLPLLVEEARKWQAEAGYWKQVATRLQRELDQRGGPHGNPAGPAAAGPADAPSTGQASPAEGSAPTDRPGGGDGG